MPLQGYDRSRILSVTNPEKTGVSHTKFREDKIEIGGLKLAFPGFIDKLYFCFKIHGVIMKKSIVACIAGVLFNPVFTTFAGGMGEVTKDNFGVYVPNLAPSYEISGGALFLRPTGNNDYGVVVSPFNPAVTLPIEDPSWQVEGINPDYSAGFFLDLRYVFPNSGSDVNLYWAHLRTNDNTSTPPLENGNPPFFQMSGPEWEIGPDANPIRNITSQAKFNYDVLNGEFGKYLNLDPNLRTRLFAGISGLWLQEQLTANFSGPTDNLNFTNINTSKFNGGGMRLGIDGQYPIYNNFNVVGLLAGDLFIGSQNPSSQFIGSSTLLAVSGIPTNFQSISHKSYIQLIPAVDAKLGLKYSYQSADNKTWSVEGGYMASIYVNAVQNYVPSTYVPGSAGINSGAIFLQGLIKTIENFTVDGPYVMVSFKA